MKASGLVLFFSFNLHTDQVNGVFQSPFPARLLVTFFLFFNSPGIMCVYVCIINEAFISANNSFSSIDFFLSLYHDQVQV